MAGKAVSTVQIDNARVRVTEWRIPPGGTTGWHVHRMDYVVVPTTSGRLTLKEPNGIIRHADLQVGAAYTREAGVEHDVINGNDYEFAFVEVELKG